MTPEEAKKLDNLLNLNMPAKNRVARSHYKNVDYTDLGHVVCVRAVQDDDGNEKQVYVHANDEEPCEAEHNIGRFIEMAEKNRTVLIDREILLEALKNLESEQVRIYVDTDWPMMVRGEVADRTVSVLIAPMVNNDWFCKDRKEDGKE